ncbi:hypothetical protein [Streptomyces antibioticus]|uniref:Lipoprotein n=1 Tax=Streptomyces antibioticus TaxID=1890 RepID=A0AAE7CPC6_STRAT|nr:hypothetical protein [Streptomyces antibioticus]OOQ47294.1 hypothetical protein AFM16_31635 [Streptomyces antibioticus]QIT47618.1 hypothetical protein HCX60_32190 [Streptomyces antibioticus]
MRRTTTILLATLLLAGAAVGCSSEKSYDEVVADCTQALKDRADGDKAKPDACEDVKKDDYTALLMSQVLDDNGWTDENGDVDMGKILEDSTSTP